MLLVAVTFAINTRFLSAQNVKDLLLGSTILAILAVGQAIVIITRNVDLSVGSILGLAAFATGNAVRRARPGLPIPVAAAGRASALGRAVRRGQRRADRRRPGARRWWSPSARCTCSAGIDYTWATGQQINAADMPHGFLRLGTATRARRARCWPCSRSWCWSVAGLFLRSYRSGRELYAIGSDPDAARLSGIPVGRRVFWAFVTSGALAGLAGVLYAARFGTIDANAGLGLELNVVAAVVVGGVAIFGGSGSVYGAALGAVLLTTIGSALPVLGINPFWQRAAVGALILAAIGLDRSLAVRMARRLRGGSDRGR